MQELFSKKRISCLEIAILVTAIFAFAYLISTDNIKLDNKESKINIGKILITFLKVWIERSKLGIVSAEEQTQPYNYEVFGGFNWQGQAGLQTVCCPRLKNNATCQEILSANTQDCATDVIPSKCENTVQCKLGCCYDSQEGLCSANTPKDSCKTVWKDDKACNIPECKLGCCVLGSQTSFVSKSRCDKLSGFLGLQPDFKAAVNTEIGCIALSNSQEEGACIYKLGNAKACRFTTKQECSKLTKSGGFYKGYLCSNPAVNVSCIKQAKTGCADGKDEVYWFDSCGNRENIYDADKDRSWNNGKVLLKSESCNSGQGNQENVNCGNCDYFSGSMCSKAKDKKPVYGNFICENLNCKDAPDNVGVKDRKNGESWCAYDGFIGDGKDVVGSRNFKYYCINGKVKVEPCGDFRTGLCVQSDNTDFSSAACRPNRAMECLSYNSKEENKDPDKLKEQCEENSDCMIQNLNFGKGYKFSICTPKYPAGFDMKDNSEAGEKICQQANIKCTKIMEKTFSGWKCISGCDCDSQKFTQQMNNWCTSLGDCGGKVNLLAETDKGYSVKVDGKPTTKLDINLEQYKKYAYPVLGQFVNPGDFSELFKAAYGWGASTGKPYAPEDPTIMLGLIGTVTGLGGAGMVYIWGAKAATAGSAAVPASSPFLAGMGSALIGAGIGMAVGLMAAQLLGIQGQGTIAMGVAGAMVGAGIGILLSTTKLGATVCAASGGNPLACGIGIGLIIVGAIIAAITIALGVGKVEKTEVNFYCQPYEPPHGGSDCGKCTQDSKITGDGLKKCSKYRCQSLGQTCEFINEGTGQESCVNINPNDVNVPVIKPWKEFITAGYNYTNITNRGFVVKNSEGECIPEFTAVMFGLITEEPAQCKYDFNHTSSYEEMQNFIGDSSLYKYNHSMAFFVPSSGSLLSQLEEKNISTEDIANLQKQILGLLDFNLYVRCIDKNGNSNIAEYAVKTCVKPGPDLTPAQILLSNPSSGSYVKYGVTEQNLTVWVNEPAECKWDYSPLKYNEMKNNFDCKNDLEDVESYGWACNSLIGNLSQNTSVYIRCKDQPWLEGKETANATRNINSQAAFVKLISSGSNLSIDSVSLNGTILFSGQEPVTQDLEVRTSGGADGKATCYYSFTGYNNMIEFLNTASSVHTQPFNLLFKGEYNLYIKCGDAAGNIAETTSQFQIEADTTAPAITRIYKKDNNLFVFTDESADCKFSFNSCDFNWENATAFSGNLKEHTIAWNQNNIYYTKCRDLWDNEPLGCSSIIKPER